jgi:hypothetical protein
LLLEDPALGAANGEAGDLGFFGCLGFFGSLLLRNCPLAMGRLLQWVARATDDR